jgi:hypothetical protein
MAYLMQSDYIARKAYDSKSCCYSKTVTNDLIPSQTGTWDLGSAAITFSEIHTDQIYINGVLFTQTGTTFETLSPVADYTIPSTNIYLDYTLWIKPEAEPPAFTIFLPTTPVLKQKVTILNDSGIAYTLDAGANTINLISGSSSTVPAVATIYSIQLLCVDATANAAVWHAISQLS